MNNPQESLKCVLPLAFNTCQILKICWKMKSAFRLKTQVARRQTAASTEKKSMKYVIALFFVGMHCLLYCECVALKSCCIVWHVSPQRFGLCNIECRRIF